MDRQGNGKNGREMMSRDEVSPFLFFFFLFLLLLGFVKFLLGLSLDEQDRCVFAMNVDALATLPFFGGLGQIDRSEATSRDWDTGCFVCFIRFSLSQNREPPTVRATAGN